MLLAAECGRPIHPPF